MASAAMVVDQRLKSTKEEALSSTKVVVAMATGARELEVVATAQVAGSLNMNTHKAAKEAVAAAETVAMAVVWESAAQARTQWHRVRHSRGNRCRRDTARTRFHHRHLHIRR